MLCQLEGVFFVAVLPLDEISVTDLLDDPAGEPLFVELDGDGVHGVSVDSLFLEGLRNSTQ